MPVQYANPLKNTRMQAVIDAIDAAAPTAGTIEIGTASFNTVLAILPLQVPSFVVGAQMISMQGVPIQAPATAAGTAGAARIKDGNGNVVVGGLTVGSGTGDVSLNSVSIIIGQNVTLNSGTITHG